MRVIEAKNYDEMSEIAARIIAAQMVLKPDSVLGLATGSTPIGTYKGLIRRYNEGKINFSEIRTANLDEYKGLDANHDQSYAYFMADNLFNHVNIKSENTNIPNGMAEDTDAECIRYDNVVKSLGGVDLQLLGIGKNGHIGFNEPADSFQNGTYCVKLTDSTIDANARFFASADDVPKYALSMGCGTIMSAKAVLLVASGKDKAQAIKDTISGPITPHVPASILQLHPNVTIVADAEALSLLNK